MNHRAEKIIIALAVILIMISILMLLHGYRLQNDLQNLTEYEEYLDKKIENEKSK